MSDGANLEISLDKNGFLSSFLTCEGKMRVSREEFKIWVNGKCLEPTMICPEKSDAESTIMRSALKYESITIRRRVSRHHIHPCPEITLEICNTSKVSHAVKLQWTITTNDDFALVSTTSSVRLIDAQAEVALESAVGKSYAKYPYINVYLCKKHKPSNTYNITFPGNLDNDVAIEIRKLSKVEDKFSVELDCGKIDPDNKAICRFVFWFSRSFSDSLGFSGVAFVVDPNDFERAVSALACRVGIPHNAVQMPLHRCFTPILWTKKGKLSSEMQALLRKMSLRLLFFLTKRSPEKCFDSIESFLLFLRSSNICTIVSMEELPENLRTRISHLGIKTYYYQKEFHCIPLDIQYNMDKIFGIEFKPRGVLIVQKNPKVMLAAAYYSKKNLLQPCFTEQNAVSAILKLRPEYAEVRVLSPKNIDKLTEALERDGVKIRVFKQKTTDTICADLALNFVLNCYVPSRLLSNSVIDPTDPGLYLFWQDANLLLEPAEFYQKVTGEQVLEFGFPSINGPPIMVLSAFSSSNWLSAITAATYADAKNALYLLIREKPPKVGRNGYNAWIRNMMRYIHEVDNTHLNATDKFSKILILRALRDLVSGSVEQRGKAILLLRTLSPSSLTDRNELKQDQIDLQIQKTYAKLLLTRNKLKGCLLDLSNELRKLIPVPVEYVINLINGINMIIFPADIRIPYELICHRDRFGDIQAWGFRFSLGRIAGQNPYQTSWLTCQNFMNSLGRNKTANALIIADPRSNLPGSLTEGKRLLSIHGHKADLLYQGKASKAKVLSKIGSFSIVHFACHGVLRKRPREICLELTGNEQLCGKDIPELKNAPIVFVNSCSGALSERLENTRNLATSFISKGAIAYIGPLLVVNDIIAASVAENFYLSLEDCPIGYSLCSAMRISLTQLDYQDYTAACYVFFGDPTIWFNSSDPLAVEADHYRQIAQQEYGRLNLKGAVRAYSRAARAYRMHAEQILEKAIVIRAEPVRQRYLIAAQGTLAYSLRCESLAYEISANIRWSESPWNPQTLNQGLPLLETSIALLKKASELTWNPYNRLKWSTELDTFKGSYYYLSAMVQKEKGDFAQARDLFRKAAFFFRQALNAGVTLGIELHLRSNLARIVDCEACVHWMSANISASRKEALTAKTLFERALRIMPSIPASIESKRIMQELEQLKTQYLIEE